MDNAPGRRPDRAGLFGIENGSKTPSRTRQRGRGPGDGQEQVRAAHGDRPGCTPLAGVSVGQPTWTTSFMNSRRVKHAFTVRLTRCRARNLPRRKHTTTPGSAHERSLTKEPKSRSDATVACRPRGNRLSCPHTAASPAGRGERGSRPAPQTPGSAKEAGRSEHLTSCFRKSPPGGGCPDPGGLSLSWAGGGKRSQAQERPGSHGGEETVPRLNRGDTSPPSPI